MAIGVATVVTLTIVLVLPDRPAIINTEKVENISMCYAISRELLARAEQGILLEKGGTFSAQCTVVVPPTVGH